LHEIARRKGGQRESVSGFEEGAHRENSYGVALQFGHEVVTGADAESHDSERGILAGVGGEAGGVHDEKILDVVVCWN